MQFSIVASCILAGVMSATALPQTSQTGNIIYGEANYDSVCRQGVNLFCTGNTGICLIYHTNDTFDAKATRMNEDSCGGLKQGDNCMQYAACIPSD